MSDYLCSNCNSDAVVPDSRRFHGEEVFHCLNCTSWFTESGEPVCFESDCGGDDLPDKVDPLHFYPSGYFDEHPDWPLPN